MAKMSAINQKIDNIAAEWTARTNLSELPAEEKAELEVWLAADIRHLGAYAKAQAIMVQVGRMQGSIRLMPEALGVCPHPHRVPDPAMRGRGVFPVQ